jgi:predicted Zn-dependent protease with MMP-like domain
MEPEWFPRPTRLTADAFERQLSAAREALHEPFKRHLDGLDVIVDDLPADELLLDSEPPLDPEQLLGMFVGVPLDEQSSFSLGGELPPQIFLFKRNLERYVSGPEELAEQIRVTLYHELGHYLGMDEEDLEGVGYD